MARTLALTTPRDRLIVALDFPSAAAALDLADRLDNRIRWFKVGLELYLATGPSIVETLRTRGFHVFVDLKLHDIPNTVAGAVRTLSSVGASLVTVHALGGRPMLLAAAEAAGQSPDSPKLLAVTVLTSMDAAQLHQVGIPDPPITQALRLAQLAADAGFSGMVCSPHECAQLRAALGPGHLLVVPGIRPAEILTAVASDDQSRTSTPASALAAGASMLVVGRPVTRSHDPAAAAEAILSEMSLS